MTAPFGGFSREVFTWFAGLERDNSKAYFTATRERYDADVRGAMVAMLEELSRAFGGEVRVFRQHRDVRFSPDKSPRGYPRDHSRLELLRHKALIAGRRLPGTAAIGREAALGHVAGTWRAAASLNAWLDQHVAISTLAVPQRRRR